eukprot:CAMPEP_0177158594 /NCGR_PEP_ID=MMETSP0367-20130122/3875_1 /TAXON_ID=447022 ORGANISM="Scrippsiella hangoei-like, Strain SHHI-4" /NCGR_SAMPLE_ID=MMETSP0367 /ASSEMBLY_ACC=CAM_ASM_000362 /LENGTH=677 /DNA_ID=CAMNT_0018604189 /DNA_START=1 /DNA_END=2034 /DNA_ORIENTATION=+
MRAIKTSQNRPPPGGSKELNTNLLDFRTAAAVSEFTLADRGLDVSKTASTKTGVKTVFAGESWINVDHRIRAAAVPIGMAIKDVAFNAEALSVEGVEAMPKKLVRRLMPRRPDWSFDVSGGRLHFRESQGFKQWLQDIQEMISDRGGYPPAFEQNLQVWRQLWRVLERCHVAALVVDARHPLLHLPPALVYHVACTLKKPLIVVMNKLDTVTPKEALAWADCVRYGIPGIAGVVGYSKESLRSDDYGSLKIGREALINECHRVYEEHLKTNGGEGAPARDAVVGEGDKLQPRLEDGRIMIGLVGHPNVGKSSLVNCIMGGNFVSVKATPGHTKTLQTLMLDDRTCLCDSPGVVFPRLEVPREVQIVGMLIPLAQVREPFSALRWVMQHTRTPLYEQLGLKKPTIQQVLELHENGIEALKLDEINLEEDKDVPWSPMLMCVQYANQRGLVTRGGPDALRAGMEILEKVLDGKVPYAVAPPPSWKRCEGSAPCAEVKPAFDDSDEESDYQAEDADYESEKEDAKAAELIAKGDLMGFFGEERQAPGSHSIASRKRQTRIEKKFEEDRTAVAMEAEKEEAEDRQALALATGNEDPASAGLSTEVEQGSVQPPVEISPPQRGPSEPKPRPAPAPAGPSAGPYWEAEFKAAPSFQGRRLGWVFKLDHRGLGYYCDKKEEADH